MLQAWNWLHRGEIERAKVFYRDHREHIVRAVESSPYKPNEGAWRLVERFETDVRTRARCEAAYREAAATFERLGKLSQ